MRYPGYQRAAWFLLASAGQSRHRPMTPQQRFQPPAAQSLRVLLLKLKVVGNQVVRRVRGLRYSPGSMPGGVGEDMIEFVRQHAAHSPPIRDLPLLRAERPHFRSNETPDLVAIHVAEGQYRAV